MLSIKLSLVTFLTFSEASPLGSGSEAIFASPPKLPKAERDLPIVDLPSGRYRASKYVKKLDTYVFKNIRFAAPPLGPLRFARPQIPARNETLQDGSYGPSCVGSLSISNIPNLDLAGLLNFDRREPLITSLLDSIKPIITQLGKTDAVDEIVALVKPLIEPGGPFGDFPGDVGDLVDALREVVGAESSEDCLFLDVYVPRKALKGTSGPMPVAHWIYGGAYIFGSKAGLYDGFGLIERSRENMIFVASNYRLGAYGFLAGRTAERANATNLGLYDQRAALQWTQDNIGAFGGDKTRVTAMGESAGAGSLMHHITAYGGKQDPLFRKAILQSPAFQPALDRDGMLEDNFKKFETAAGCGGQGFDCLNGVPQERITQAADVVIKAAPPGTFGFGPSADGAFVRQIPGLEFAAGAYFKDLDSMILSHTSNEPTLFTNPNIRTQRQLDQFVRDLLPKDASVQRALREHEQLEPTIQGRLAELIQGSSFTCNVRYMTQAFAGKTFNMQYSNARGTHGSDIATTFFSDQSPLTGLIGLINPTVPKVAAEIQSYFASYIVTGDPNNSRTRLTPMPKPRDGTGEVLFPILDVGARITNIQDPDTTLTECGFWQDLGAGATNVLGLAPPGAVVQSSIESGDPSRNFYSPDGKGSSRLRPLSEVEGTISADPLAADQAQGVIAANSTTVRWNLTWWFLLIVAVIEVLALY